MKLLTEPFPTQMKSQMIGKVINAMRPCTEKETSALMPTQFIRGLINAFPERKENEKREERRRQSGKFFTYRRNVSSFDG